MRTVETKKYIIYEDGRIYSKCRKKFRNFPIGKHGYYVFTDADNEGKTTSVQRKVYKSFYGEISKNMKITHIDGDKLNNHIDNLRMTDKVENHNYVLIEIDGKSKIIEEYMIIRNFMRKIKLNFGKQSSRNFKNGRESNRNEKLFCV